MAHPAVFSMPILHAMGELLTPVHRRILDPFAGVGTIHHLAEALTWSPVTVGVEIEREWAECHERTRHGSALSLRKLFGGTNVFDAVVTSPCYGNRLADHHVPRDGSYRRSYRADLGRDLDDQNAGRMQWGETYRAFHRLAWASAAEVLRPGGRLVLNISDHIRGGRRRYVTAWHAGHLRRLGFLLADVNRVVTRRHGYGANRDARTPSEMVLAFDYAPDRAGTTGLL